MNDEIRLVGNARAAAAPVLGCGLLDDGTTPVKRTLANLDSVEVTRKLNAAASGLLSVSLMPVTQRDGIGWDIGPSDRGQIESLIAILGGDPEVAAFYDARFGVTAAAGLAEQWEDYRGRGHAPPLIATGTARPAWDGSALVFDGVDDILVTAIDSRFGLDSDKTLVFVGSIIGTNPAHYPVVYLATADVSSFFGIDTSTDSSTGLGGISGEPGTEGPGTIDSGVARGNTRRVVLLSQTATGVRIEVPNHTAVVDVVDNETGSPGMTRLVVGSDGVDFDPPSDIVACAVIVLNHAYTNADRDAIKAWAVAQHGAVLA